MWLHFPYTIIYTFTLSLLLYYFCREKGTINSPITFHISFQTAPNNHTITTLHNPYSTTFPLLPFCSTYQPTRTPCSSGFCQSNHSPHTSFLFVFYRVHSPKQSSTLLPRKTTQETHTITQPVDTHHLFTSLIARSRAASSYPLSPVFGQVNQPQAALIWLPRICQKPPKNTTPSPP